MSWTKEQETDPKSVSQSLSIGDTVDQQPTRYFRYFSISLVFIIISFLIRTYAQH